MAKFPKTVFIRREQIDGEENFLAVDENLSHENAGEEIAEYQLVRKGKIQEADVQVNWDK